MIMGFLSVWLVSWGLARLLRRVTTPPPTATTPYTPLKQHHALTSRPLGLEDDPTHWPPAPVRGDWTALDERQLIRLLTDSATMTPPAAGDIP